MLVYDKAGLEAALIAAMESETSRILGKADIGTTWVDCSNAFEATSPCREPLVDATLVLRIIREHDQKVSIPDSALGCAAGGGSYVTVLMDRIEKMVHKHEGLVMTGEVLGYTVAHEIGH